MKSNARTQGPSLLQRTADALDASAAAAGRVAAATTVATSATTAGAKSAAGGVDLPEMDASTTGVVFVHGIGEQARAEILLGWSRPIVRAVADRRVDLEITLEEALGDQRLAADRLTHCRTINAPGWRA